MKNIKKLLSIVMVLAMVLALGTQALAATVTVDADEDMGETYSAWQIFSGTTDDADPNAGATNKLGDLEWGVSITDHADFVRELLKQDFASGLNAALNPDGDDATADPADNSKITAKDVAVFLGGEDKGTKDDTEVAEKFAQFAYDYLTNKKVTAKTTLKAGPNDIDDGYWLIVEDDFEGNKVINPALLQLTDKGNVHIKKKADIPSIDKKVKDINDSDPEQADNGVWQNTADHDIGDIIEYQLTVTIGKDFSRFEDYYLNFADILSHGLTFKGVTSIKLLAADGSELADLGKIAPVEADYSEDWAKAHGYTPNADFNEDYAGGKCLTWDFDLKIAGEVQPGFEKATDYCKIVIEYTAELNESARHGVPGNPNTLTLEYNRNPNKSEEGWLAPKTAIVFTYKLDTDKVDGGKQPLEGAAFTLLKKQAAPAGTTATTVDSWENLKGITEGYVVYGDETYKVVKAYDVVAEKTNFSFDGIDDGEYLLVETVVPEGYNRADDIPFTVEATHPNETQALTDLVVKNKDGILIKSDTTGGAFAIDMEKGEISNDVINQNGLELPETGGIGTTIFYVVGAILVAGAAILLVTKKRANDATK